MMAGLLLSASVTLNLFGESRPKYCKPYYPLEDTCAQSTANNQSFIATRICTSLFSLSKTTKAPHPLEKKNANLSWCPGCFSNPKTRSSLLMAAACESAVSVFTDQAWESSHVQTLTRTVQHVNSKSKLFGSVTCMFFT